MRTVNSIITELRVLSCSVPQASYECRRDLECTFRQKKLKAEDEDARMIAAIR